MNASKGIHPLSSWCIFEFFPRLANMDNSTIDSIVYFLGAHLKLLEIHLVVELLYYGVGKCSKHNILTVIQAYTLL